MISDMNEFNGYMAEFESTGAAMTLPVPFEPDSIKVYNYTKFGTNDNTLVAFWFKGFPDGDALLIERGTTDLTSTLETTNGITEAHTEGGPTASQVAISGATQADPVVITTSSAHGLVSGERVIITNVVGMLELNQPSRNPYQVNVLTSTTFELQDIKGNDIDGTSFSAYTSGGTVNKISRSGDNANDWAAPTWNLTLGTEVVGADGDVLYVEVFKYNKVEKLEF